MKRRRSILLKLAHGFLWSYVMLCAMLVGGGTVLSISVAASDFSLKLLARKKSALRVYDRKGGLLREIRGANSARNALVTSLAQVPANLLNAFIAAEDHRFHDHDGIDPQGILRAAWNNLWAGKVVEGGSTITQQLVRILKPRPRNLLGKLAEAVDAMKLERLTTKKEILKAYLNHVPYGRKIQGVALASQYYLRKPHQQVSLAEAAALASIPNGPKHFNPATPAGRRLIEERRIHILNRMHALSFIDRQAYRRAVREPIRWEIRSSAFTAPHLTEMVRQRYNGEPLTEEVKTTLEPNLQMKVETIVRRNIGALKAREVHNAAVVVLDNATGEVLSLVGSVDFHDAFQDGQVNGTLSLRQPGSALKPFLYALALEKGFTSAHIIPDLPVSFQTPKGPYRPRNYDEKFHGPVRLRAALANSYNIPAVTLLHQLTAKTFLEKLRSLGLRSLNREADHYGLGLVLGAGEVRLIDLAAAYATLARGGIYLKPIFIRKGEGTNKSQKSMETPQHRIFSEEVSYLVSHIMRDQTARMPAFGENSVLNLNFEVAVKTGTSKNFRDNWTVGFTPQVTVAVWVGNFDGSPMGKVSGITGAGPIFRDVMIAAMGQGLPRWKENDSFVKVQICPLSGQLKGPHCPGKMEEIFRPANRPRRLCPFHRHLRLHRQSGLLAGEACPRSLTQWRKLVHLPLRYRDWALKQELPLAPALYARQCPPLKGADRLLVQSPKRGNIFSMIPHLPTISQKIPLKVSVAGSVKRVFWIVDGKTVSSRTYPFSAWWQPVPGKHWIQVKTDSGLHSSKIAITVN